MTKHLSRTVEKPQTSGREFGSSYTYTIFSSLQICIFKENLEESQLLMQNIYYHYGKTNFFKTISPPTDPILVAMLVLQAVMLCRMGTTPIYQHLLVSHYIWLPTELTPNMPLTPYFASGNRYPFTQNPSRSPHTPHYLRLISLAKVKPTYYIQCSASVSMQAGVWYFTLHWVQPLSSGLGLLF